MSMKVRMVNLPMKKLDSNHNRIKKRLRGMTIAFAISSMIVSMKRQRANERNARTELDRVYSELAREKRRADENEKAKDAFASKVNCELRVPMNAIAGYIGMAQKCTNLEKKREYLNKMHDVSNHIHRAINEILDTSNIKSGILELSVSAFSLQQILNQVVRENSFRFERKSQNFFMYIDPKLPSEIWTDSQRLSQVITNLLSNASKFAPCEKSISLFVKLQDEREDIATIRFEVKDEGIGMASEQVSHLFKDYDEVDNCISTHHFHDSGLGLTISKKIIEKMDGQIWVKSAPNQGSCFYFEIKVKKGNTMAHRPVPERILLGRETIPLT